MRPYDFVVRYMYFGGILCIRLQCTFFYTWMKVAHSSEKSVPAYKNTRCRNSEDSGFRSTVVRNSNITEKYKYLCVNILRHFTLRRKLYVWFNLKSSFHYWEYFSIWICTAMDGNNKEYLGIDLKKISRPTIISK